MKKQFGILGAVLFVPALLSGTALAADQSRGPYLVSPDGAIVRNSSGECWHTPAWTPAAEAQCTGAKSAATPVVAPQAAVEAPVAAAPVVTAAPEPVAAAPAPVVAETPVVIAAPAAAKPAVENFSVSGAALFEFDRAELKPDAQKQLSELAGKVKSQKDLDEVVITGYADAMGPEPYNEVLSKKRAESVKDFLLQQGVVSKRVVIQAMGEEKPVASNDTAEGRAQNRRVEVSITATGDKQ